jgi:S-adenosylmethionine/arginine decarboxylase-like enzyme
MEKLFHQHLLLRAYVKNPPKQEEVLNQWMLELIQDIKMEIAVPPRSCYVDKAGNEGLTGSIAFTGVANIQTSHFAIHIWDGLELPKIEMDLYSCSCFSEMTILKKLSEWDLVKYYFIMVDRNQIPFTIVNQTQDEVLWDSQKLLD